MVKLADTIERKMFYGASPLTFERAKWLRENQTVSEVKLWNHIKNKQILDLRFKRQHPISIFIADFYCHKLKLVIEVDGEIHLNKKALEYDEGRSAELDKFEIKVIRFTNNQVLEDIENVISAIKQTCKNLLKE